MKYGERLRLAREKAELTQQDLAELVGMKQPSLAYLENPAKNAKGSEFTVKLSRVLGVSVDWLDDEIGEMKPTLYSTSDPMLVEILQALEPRANYDKMAAHKAVVATLDLVDHAVQAADQAKAGSDAKTESDRPSNTRRSVNARERNRELDRREAALPSQRIERVKK